MEAWESAFGDRAVVPSEIGPPSDYHEYFPYRELCDLLRAVACGGKESAQKVGWWLGSTPTAWWASGASSATRRQRRWRLEGAKPLRRRAEQVDLENGAGSEGEAKPSKTAKSE